LKPVNLTQKPRFSISLERKYSTLETAAPQYKARFFAKKGQMAVIVGLFTALGDGFGIWKTLKSQKMN
jgi:hypothetical protein